MVSVIRSPQPRIDLGIKSLSNSLADEDDEDQRGEKGSEREEDQVPLTGDDVVQSLVDELPPARLRSGQAKAQKVESDERESAPPPAMKSHRAHQAHDHHGGKDE